MECKLSSLAIGGASLAQADDMSICDTLQVFAANGGKWLDISPGYGGWRQIKRIGEFVRRVAPTLKPLVKLGYFVDSVSYRSPEALRRQCSQTLEAFGMPPAAILLHEADWGVWWQDTDSPTSPLDCLDTVDAGISATLCDLGREYDCEIGITGNNAPALAMAVTLCPQAEIVMIAKQTDLLWASGDSLATHLAENNRTVILAAPFHQGWLFQLDAVCKARPSFAKATCRLASILGEAGLGIEDSALPFLRAIHPDAVIMVGAMRPGEVSNAVKTINQTLSPRLTEAIRRNRLAAPAMPGKPLVVGEDGLLSIQW